METPSSTRSQASLVSRAEKKLQEGAEEPLSSLSKSRGENKDRTVLLDITNDSPIVGLAMGTLKTPSSSACKSSAWGRRRTPASGEALLRGQVKILLQKVEEEAEGVKHFAEQPAPFQTLLGHLRSPTGLLAPTPANTPQIMGLTGIKEDVGSELPRAAGTGKDEEEPRLDLGECLINRALFEYSPEKSDISESSPSLHSSALTYQGSDISSCPEEEEEDSSSAWSTGVNVSSQKDGEEEEDCEGAEDFGDDDGDGSSYCEGEEEEEEESESLDAVCEGLRLMWVQEKKGIPPEFVGKHTRFIYNSDDDEIEGEEVVVGMGMVVSPGVLCLKGLPVPQGKHLRFQEEEGEED